MSDLVPETRALKALLALIGRTSQKEVAAKAKVKQPTLSQIANRRRLPGREVALALEKVGIKSAWWAEPTVRGKAA